MWCLYHTWSNVDWPMHTSTGIVLTFDTSLPRSWVRTICESPISNWPSNTTLPWLQDRLHTTTMCSISSYQYITSCWSTISKVDCNSMIVFFVAFKLSVPLDVQICGKPIAEELAAGSYKLQTILLKSHFFFGSATIENSNTWEQTNIVKVRDCFEGRKIIRNSRDKLINNPWNC